VIKGGQMFPRTCRTPTGSPRVIEAIQGATQGVPGVYLEQNRAVELPKRAILPTTLITRARARGLLRFTPDVR